VTILSVIQDISTTIGVEKPAAVFSSTEREHVELAALANEIAERIQHAYDWQRVKRTQTYTGDGTTTSFALPSDYSRMAAGKPNAALVRSSSTLRVEQVQDHDDWLDMQVRNWTPACLSWTILGGMMQFYPAPAAGEVLKWHYISTLYVRSSGTSVSDFFPLDLPYDFADGDEFGTRKAAFTEDGDFFQLDDRLLRLGMIWQWNANKGLPYAEDMQNYELHLAQRINKDIGRRGFGIGRRSGYGDAYAYPFAISG
jgi:hypothetical protein